MASAPIQQLGEEPVGVDDIRWKREVMRVLNELISREQADRSDIDYLKGLR